jgi:hypothetical protein
MAGLQLRRPCGAGDAVSTTAVSSRRDVAFVDILDRLLDGAVDIAGDITLAVADIDLVYVGLRALVASVASAEREGMPLPR